MSRNRDKEDNNSDITKILAIGAAIGAGIYAVNKVLTEKTIRGLPIELVNDKIVGNNHQS